MNMTSTLSPGIDATRIARLSAAINEDIEADKFDGAVVLVAHRGTVVLHEAFGYADRAANKPARLDSVFITMSIFKQMVNAAVLQRIDRGEIGFTTQVRELIPDYAANGKGATTIADLMLHKAGLPLGAPGIPPEKIGDIQAVSNAVSAMVPQSVPGTSISYAAVLGHAVLAEIVRRLDGGHRSFGQILKEDLIEPLGMTDTSLGFGLREDQIERAVPVVVKNHAPALLDPAMLEGAGKHAAVPGFEIPAGSAYTTAYDWFRFAEACRRGGEIDGARILSPAILRFARTIATADMTNSLWDYAQNMRGWPAIPANLGPGFYVRGTGITSHAFGQLSSPATFGGIGTGSTCFWVDPERELTYVFLSAGLMEDSYSWERHQRYADLVQSSVID
ncbi:serine hydrolase [Pseudomonas sp. FP597]|uniref:Beta-lactamase family protein n=1 Tax=Pseudomonas lactucae TaxID=2813360 RepID=A0A9X0Y9C5_9PSED|nr:MULTISPECIES: serine hydrolase domain-containing protein [Pseudomonas]MBN2975775.1 beta-lactamase family protein [Pseudomonas lactucae]MBN2985897.1 beta-lactamase family protein [Pseudomonas lactucae]WLI08894.1 serine hydrolase [Pseudomonas sp. FP597]